MVTVTSDTPLAPTVFFLPPCGSGTGDMVTLGCLATEFTPGSLTFSWTKSGDNLTDFIQYPPVQKGQYYTGVSQVQVSRQDWEAKQPFQCAVQHVAGDSDPVPPLHPEPVFQLPVLKVLASSPDDASETSFSCFAKDFSPKEYEIKWLKDDGEIFDKIHKVDTPVTERLTKGKKLYSVASFLVVKTNDLDPSSTFTCEFKGKDVSGQDAFVNSTVTYGDSCPETDACEKADVEIEITGPTMKEMFVENKGTLLCKVKVNKPEVTMVSWEDERQKTLGQSSQDDGSKGVITLSLDITYDEWSAGITRVCVVQHSKFSRPIKEVYERKIEGTVQRPSVFMLPPVEQAKTGTVTLTCFVKEFFPKEVLVSWLVDDVPADSDYDISTTIPVENRGSYSVYGQLTVSLKEWKENEAVYSCVIHHESVVDTSKVIVRSYAHRSSQTNLVNLNMNIPETCKTH